MEDSEDKLRSLLCQNEEETQDAMSVEEKAIWAGTPPTEINGDMACILDCRRKRGRGLKERQKVETAVERSRSQQKQDHTGQHSMNRPMYTLCP